MSEHFGAWASGLLLLSRWVGLKMLALFYLGELKKGGGDGRILRDFSCRGFTLVWHDYICRG